MKRTLAAISTIALAAAPTAAFANTATLHLMLRVPVQCTLDVVGGAIVNNAVVLQVYRNCNTGHDVVLTGLHESGLGNVSVNYNGEVEAIAGDQFSMSQAERFYDQTDSVVIEAPGASVEQMQQLAGSLQLSVVV